MRYFLLLTMTIVACASKPPAKSPASTAHSDAFPKSSVEAKQIAAEEDAAFVAEISFKKNSADLTARAKKNLEKMLKEARNAGTIAELKSIAWADSEYPSPATKELSQEDQNLAKNRNAAILKWAKSHDARFKVTAYAMTSRPNSFQEWFGSSSSRIKKSLEKAGLPNTDTAVKIPSKVGKAIVMAILKD